MRSSAFWAKGLSSSSAFWSSACLVVLSLEEGVDGEEGDDDDDDADVCVILTSWESIDVFDEYARILA